jgi:dTDP-4-dehydrorhamnose 3,5-epimerase
MKLIATELADVLVLEPRRFGDDRGWFYESYNARVLAELGAEVGLDQPFVQDNHSRSQHHVLRGLHYQIRQPQGKLVRVVVGEVFDVAVDLRRSSPTFGQWVGRVLSAENGLQLWVPPGFAHGFLVRSAAAEVLYKTTDYYAPEYERCLAWDDRSVAIDWGLTTQPILSTKDQLGERLASADCFD